MRKPVIGAIKGKHAMSLGGERGSLERALHRVAAAETQHHARIVEGSEPLERLQQRDLHVRRMHVTQRMQ